MTADDIGRTALDRARRRVVEIGRRSLGGKGSAATWQLYGLVRG